MNSSAPQHTFIKTESDLQAWADDHRDIDWMGFDTEFIGEKRYHTLLCLIQVSTVHGYYLIDPLAIDNLDPFLDLLEDEGIVKITHAGDNDYRLMHRQFDLVPRNVFDTQIAAGFIGHRYPTSFAKLVEAECEVSLGKGSAVTDWSKRPMSQKQVRYALNDVIYLRELYDKITDQLKANGRLEWALEECAAMTNEDYYYRDPNHEFLNSNAARSARLKERIFLLRLYEWRREQAEKKDYSKEMILQSKLIGQLVRGVKGGLNSMMENRRLPQGTIKRYGEFFVELYERPATPEEETIARSVKRNNQEDEEDDLLIELLYLIMKHRANEAEISHALVMPRNAIKKMKNDPKVRQQLLGSGWRQALLGPDFVNWVKQFDDLKVEIEGGSIRLVAG